MVSKCQFSVLFLEGKHEIKRQLYSNSFTLWEAASFIFNTALMVPACILHTAALNTDFDSCPLRPLNLRLKSAVRCGRCQKPLRQGGGFTLHACNAALLPPKNFRPRPTGERLYMIGEEQCDSLFGILGPSSFLLDAKIGRFSVPRSIKNLLPCD